eukprot:6199795-Alexandrium_andersonii.AAC.1
MLRLTPKRYDSAIILVTCSEVPRGRPGHHHSGEAVTRAAYPWSRHPRARPGPSTRELRSIPKPASNRCHARLELPPPRTPHHATPA